MLNKVAEGDIKLSGIWCPSALQPKQTHLASRETFPHGPVNLGKSSQTLDTGCMCIPLPVKPDQQPAGKCSFYRLNSHKRYHEMPLH